MTGNKKSSGLQHTKLDTECTFIALTSRIISELFVEALSNGTEQALQQKLLRYATEWKHQPDGANDPLYGTIFGGADAQCRRGENDICAEHGKLEWITCRTTRVDEAARRGIQKHRRAPGQKRAGLSVL